MATLYTISNNSASAINRHEVDALKWSDARQEAVRIAYENGAAGLLLVTDGMTMTAVWDGDAFKSAPFSLEYRARVSCEMRRIESLLFGLHYGLLKGRD